MPPARVSEPLMYFIVLGNDKRGGVKISLNLTGIGGDI